jgi:hypothetical protein
MRNAAKSVPGCDGDLNDNSVAAHSPARRSAHLDLLGLGVGGRGSRARHSPRHVRERRVTDAARVARIDPRTTLGIHRIQLRSCILSRFAGCGRAQRPSRRRSPRGSLSCGSRRVAGERPTRIGAGRSDCLRVRFVRRRMRGPLTRNRLPRTQPSVSGVIRAAISVLRSRRPAGSRDQGSRFCRTVVKVYAVRRKNGEQFLLLYEDIARRKRPVQIIRFRPAGSVALPDSSSELERGAISFFSW